jgi:hypothetical protein
LRTPRSSTAPNPSPWLWPPPSSWRAMRRRWSGSSTNARCMPRISWRGAKERTCRDPGSSFRRCRRRAVKPRRPSPTLPCRSKRSTSCRWSITTRWSRSRRRWSGTRTASSPSMTRRRGCRTSGTTSATCSASRRTTCASSPPSSVGRSAWGSARSTRCSWPSWRRGS